MKVNFQIVHEYEDIEAILFDALKEAYAQVVGLQIQLETCQGQFRSTKSELEAAQTHVSELIALREKLEKRVAQSRAEVAVDLAALTAAQLKIKDDAIVEANQKIAELTSKLDKLQG